MKIILKLIIISAFHFKAFGQNYSLFSNIEEKTYFINADGYLKGMRIDSVKIDGENIISFPFKTARILDKDHLYDSIERKGSWLGEMVIENDEWIRIPNINNDTLSFRKSAALGESWTFFQDATYHYTATYILNDTMTFAGITDSVKIIEINRLDESGSIISTDSFSGIKIILSKENGLFQTFDFYFFPYYTFYFTGFDTDHITDIYQDRIYQFHSSKDIFTFRRIQSIVENWDEFFNLQLGDEFIYHQTRLSFSNPPLRETITTSVISTTSTDTSVSYVTSLPSLNYGTFNKASVFNHLMPEEWGVNQWYFYNPDDSSYCVRSPTLYVDGMAFFGYVPDTDEYEHAEGTFDNEFKLKQYFGYILSSTFNAEAYFYSHSIYLAYATKDGIGCREDNDPTPLSISSKELNAQNQILVYPNPSKDLITIKTNNDSKFNISIIDIAGRKLGSYFQIASGQNIDVSSLSPGTYILELELNGEKYFKKFLKLQ